MLLLTIDTHDWNDDACDMSLDINDVMYAKHKVDVALVNLRDSGLADRDPARYNAEVEAIVAERIRIDAMRETVENTHGPVYWGYSFARYSDGPVPTPKPTKAELIELERLRVTYTDIHQNDGLTIDDLFTGGPEVEARIQDVARQAAPHEAAYRAELERLRAAYPAYGF